MALGLRLQPATPEPRVESHEPALRPLVSAQSYLAQLAALHDEAAQTAHLANLLGRTPWMAGLLAAGAFATVLAVGGTTAGAPLFVWLMLVAVAAGALARSYMRAIGAPFDRNTLQNFARETSAILLYAGFAWGAGLFLALPAQAGIVGLVAFSAGLSAAMVAVVRAREVAFCFLAPATAMGAFAALMRPVGASPLALLAILAAGVVVALTLVAVERICAAIPRPLHS